MSSFFISFMVHETYFYRNILNCNPRITDLYLHNVAGLLDFVWQVLKGGRGTWWLWKLDVWRIHTLQLLISLELGLAFGSDMGLDKDEQCCALLGYRNSVLLGTSRCSFRLEFYCYSIFIWHFLLLSGRLFSQSGILSSTTQEIRTVVPLPFVQPRFMRSAASTLNLLRRDPLITIPGVTLLAFHSANLNLYCYSKFKSRAIWLPTYTWQRG